MRELHADGFALRHSWKVQHVTAVMREALKAHVSCNSRFLSVECEWRALFFKCRKFLENTYILACVHVLSFNGNSVFFKYMCLKMVYYL
jgi:hypothetical protein